MLASRHQPVIRPEVLAQGCLDAEDMKQSEICGQNGLVPTQSTM